MRLGGECAPLPGFKVHHIVALPLHMAMTMVFQYLLSAFAQHAERDPEAAVGRLRPRNRLEQQINWRSTV